MTSEPTNKRALEVLEALKTSPQSTRKLDKSIKLAFRELCEDASPKASDPSANDTSQYLLLQLTRRLIDLEGWKHIEEALKRPMKDAQRLDIVSQLSNDALPPHPEEFLYSQLGKGGHEIAKVILTLLDGLNTPLSYLALQAYAKQKQDKEVSTSLLAVERARQQRGKSRFYTELARLTAEGDTDLPGSEMALPLLTLPTEAVTATLESLRKTAPDKAAALYASLIATISSYSEREAEEKTSLSTLVETLAFDAVAASGWLPTKEIHNKLVDRLNRQSWDDFDKTLVALLHPTVRTALLRRKITPDTSKVEDTRRWLELITSTLDTLDPEIEEILQSMRQKDPLTWTLNTSLLEAKLGTNPVAAHLRLWQMLRDRLTDQAGTGHESLLPSIQKEHLLQQVYRSSLTVTDDEARHRLLKLLWMSNQPEQALRLMEMTLDTLGNRDLGRRLEDLHCMCQLLATTPGRDVPIEIVQAAQSRVREQTAIEVSALATQNKADAFPRGLFERLNVWLETPDFANALTRNYKEIVCLTPHVAAAEKTLRRLLTPEVLDEPGTVDDILTQLPQHTEFILELWGVRLPVMPAQALERWWTSKQAHSNWKRYWQALLKAFAAQAKEIDNLEQRAVVAEQRALNDLISQIDTLLNKTFTASWLSDFFASLLKDIDALRPARAESELVPPTPLESKEDEAGSSPAHIRDPKLDRMLSDWLQAGGADLISIPKNSDIEQITQAAARVGLSSPSYDAVIDLAISVASIATEGSGALQFLVGLLDTIPTMRSDLLRIAAEDRSWVTLAVQRTLEGKAEAATGGLDVVSMVLMTRSGFQCALMRLYKEHKLDSMLDPACLDEIESRNLASRALEQGIVAYRTLSGRTRQYTERFDKAGRRALERVGPVLGTRLRGMEILLTDYIIASRKLSEVGFNQIEDGLGSVVRVSPISVSHTNLSQSRDHSGPVEAIVRTLGLQLDHGDIITPALIEEI